MALVLTVDLNGCADFSSVQEAVNAVPDSSPSRTLIVIDSGTYRSFSHTKFSSLDFFFLIYHNRYKKQVIYKHMQL